MSFTPRSVKSLLHTVDSELGAVVRHAGYLATVRKVILEVLPGHAAAHIHVAAVDGQRLLLHTDSAGWATRLRYAEPAIRQALAQKMRVHANTVVTRVRPALAPPMTSRTGRQISAANREHMRRVAAYIDDPELAQTLLRLANQNAAGDTPQAAATGRALT